MIFHRKLFLAGIIIIIIGFLILIAKISNPIAFSMVVDGVIIALYSRVETLNYSTIAAIIFAATSCILGYYAIAVVKEPPEPNLNVTSIDNISMYEPSSGYSRYWDISLPIQLRVFVQNPSDLSFTDFNFIRDTSKDNIFVSGMEDETMIIDTNPRLIRIHPSDSNIDEILYLNATAWIRPDYGWNYGGITKVRIGNVSFNVNVFDLSSGKSKTVPITRDVFWVRDLTYKSTS